MKLKKTKRMLKIYHKAFLFRLLEELQSTRLQRKERARRDTVMSHSSTVQVTTGKDRKMILQWKRRPTNKPNQTSSHKTAHTLLHVHHEIRIKSACMNLIKDKWSAVWTQWTQNHSLCPFAFSASIVSATGTIFSEHSLAWNRRFFSHLPSLFLKTETC